MPQLTSRSQVAQRVLGTPEDLSLSLSPSLLFMLVCLTSHSQVAQRVLGTPEDLHLDPPVFERTMDACVAIHAISQRVRACACLFITVSPHSCNLPTGVSTFLDIITLLCS